MQLIIPMSGIGKRFMDRGYSVPKPLIQISGRPMLKHVIEMFPGVEDVLFIVNREHFMDPELNLEKRLKEVSPTSSIAVVEPHKLGPGWAIREAKHLIKQDVPVVVNYCDFSCNWDFPSFQEKLESGIDGLIATYSGFHPHMLRNNQYAYLKLNEHGDLIQIQEKLPFTIEPMNEPASSGTYGFGTGKILLDAIEAQIAEGDSYNREFYISLTYNNMITRGMIIKQFPIQEFFQWGTPEDFEEFKSRKDFFTYKSNHLSGKIDVQRIEILAAGEGKRFSDAGYKTLKPFLPTNNSNLALEAFQALGFPIGSRGLLLQEEAKVSISNLAKLKESKIEIRRVQHLTKGQADSALLSMSNGGSGSCIVAACDSLLYPRQNMNFPKNSTTLGVWVTSPSDFAKENPCHFGWVSLASGGQVNGVWVKEEPPFGVEAWVITGTFFFGDVSEGCELIEKFLLMGKTTQEEFYLDNLLSFAQQCGWTVVGFFPESFMSLGTPHEYETFVYWERVFNSRKDLLVYD